MSMLDGMIKRQDEYKTKYGARGGGAELWTKEGDITYFHIIKDDTAFGEMYVAHAVPQEGSSYDKLVYCPMYSFHDDNAAEYACPYDETDAVRPDGSPMYPLKQRILMWLWVHKSYRLESSATSDSDRQLPVEERNGQRYRVREYNKPVLWEVSGWQTFSPIADFNILRENLNGDLTSKMLTMRHIGRGLEMRRRFDVVTDSDRLTAEQASQATETCTPIRKVLLERLTNAQQAGDTVRRPDGWTPEQQKQADKTMQAAGHTPYTPPAPATTPEPEAPAETAGGVEPEPHLPSASDPEGFEPKSFKFDPEDPFGV